jgi:micrococcal nuclease
MRRLRIISGRKGLLTRRDLQVATVVFASVLAIALLMPNALGPLRSDGAPPAASGVADPVQLRTVDGDTFEVRGTGERIRLANVDTPEAGNRAACAAERSAASAATSRARQLVDAATRIDIRRTGRVDQYDRTIGFILLDGQDLGERLIADGFARTWRGRREEWCAADGSLQP